jgi:hypothetical protein
MPATYSLIFVLFASLASAQTDRVLQFSQPVQAASVSEIASMIHIITDADITPEGAAKTLTVHGTSDQMALAEWMFSKVDQPQIPAPNNWDATEHEYRLPGSGENTVRLFFLTTPAAATDFYAIGTAIRTIGDVRRVGANGGTRTIAVRGTSEQIAVAAWIVNTLDRPADQRADSRDLQMPASSDARGETAVRVVYVSNAATPQDFQEIAVAARITADVRRVFTLDASKAILVRATAGQISMFDWLVQQLDKPAARPAGAAHGSGTYEYDTAWDRDNMVQVFYVPQVSTVKDFQQFATRIRTAANIRRVFTYNAPRAIAVRGTIDQIAMAERMVNDLAGAK